MAGSRMHAKYVVLIKKVASNDFAKYSIDKYYLHGVSKFIEMNG